MTKILIIDDNIHLLEMYEMQFKNNWFEVILSSDSFEAIELAERIIPEIILLDLMMPWINWIDILRKLKRKNKDSLIIINSNLEQQRYFDDAKKHWADDFLVKSNYSPKKLMEKILEMLENKK